LYHAGESGPDRIDHRSKSASRGREIMLHENALPRSFCERRPLAGIDDGTTHRRSERKGVIRCDE